MIALLCTIIRFALYSSARYEAQCGPNAISSGRSCWSGTRLALIAGLRSHGGQRISDIRADDFRNRHRRRIARQLNKGENLHALRRELAYAGEGAVRRRHHEQQSEQMWCLTVATNAIVTWTTEYYGLAVTALRDTGHSVDDDVLAHIWPSHHANVNFYGTHSVDIDSELAKLDTDGYRPLRPPAGPAYGNTARDAPRTQAE